MNRRNVLTLCVIAASGIVLLPSAAVGQQKSLKEQLVGAWTLVSAVDILPDGSKSEPWGSNPKGAYMFDANGRFAQMLMRSDLPKLTSRLQGTPEQNKAMRKAPSPCTGRIPSTRPTRSFPCILRAVRSRGSSVRTESELSRPSPRTS